MKRILVVLLLGIQISVVAQEFGSSVQFIRSRINSKVRFHQHAQGNKALHYTKDLRYIDGEISEVILISENMFDLYLRRHITVTERFLIDADTLAGIIKHFDDVSLKELRAYMKALNKGGQVEDYYFKEGNMECSKVFLSTNGLASILIVPWSSFEIPAEIRQPLLDEKARYELLMEEEEQIAIRQAAIEDSLNKLSYDLRVHFPNETIEIDNLLIKQIVRFYTTGSQPSFRELLESESGYHHFLSTHSVRFALEDHSRPAQERGGFIIAGSNNFETVLKCDSINDSCELFEGSRIKLRRKELNGRSVLTHIDYDSLEISIYKGVVDVMVKYDKLKVKSKDLPSEIVALMERNFVEDVLGKSKMYFVAGRVLGRDVFEYELKWENKNLFGF